MPIFRRSALLLPLAALAPLLLAADPPAPAAPAVLVKGLPAPRGYVCLKAPAAPTIDGSLDDPAWQAAPWSDDFADIEGESRPKPRHRTRLKMLWDDKALYIAAELEEPHVWATIDRHNAVVFEDPDFEVFLDPDCDGHLYAELELNAKNATWDLLLPKPYKDGGRALNGWEAIGLKTAVRVDGTLNDPREADKGWTVEIAWPWEGLKELSAAPAAGRRPLAGELLARRVGYGRRGRQVRQGEGEARAQLGLVAAGGHRHAPPRALGHRAVQRGDRWQSGVPA